MIQYILKPLKLLEKKDGYWIEFVFGSSKNSVFFVADDIFFVRCNQDFEIYYIPKKYESFKEEIEKLVIDNKIKLILGDK